ncbi:MAG: hypothetical protein RIF33_10415 [Cyclobacteriaceae bacterium]
MTTIITPTNDLSESLDFYKRLNFTTLSEADPVIVAGGSAIVEINPDRYTRPGVKMYASSWGKVVEELKQKTVVHTISEGYLLNDMSGCWIYLIEGDPKFENPISEVNPALPGNFAGLSLEASDVHKSIGIWQTLGFSITMGSPEDSYCVLANDDDFKVSIMRPLVCPHLFFNPAFTYFNSGKNLEVIQKIREANIPISEEITHFNNEGIVDNIIIRDPGGYGFFIFND